MNFVKALLEQGHEVHTIAPEDDYTKLLTAVGCNHHNVYMDSRGASPLKDFALMLELTMLYKKVKPDVILHYTIKPNVYGSMAAALAGIPAINNVCGLGTVFLKEGLVSKIAKFLYKISFRFPKKVFFQNPDDLQLFLDKAIIRDDKTELLPGSGIDLNQFEPQPFKRNNTFTFLVVSRILFDKGIIEYIEAIKILKAKGVNAKFQLLGGKDPEHKRGIPLVDIDNWISQGLIDYLGKTSDVRPYLSAADCVVLPSYREGSPRSLMEAAAMSKPIVTTNVPGCNQVVVGGFNGLLCESHNPEDLADKMLQMMEFSDVSLQLMGECGRRKMELEFSDTIIVDRYTSVMKKVEHDAVAKLMVS
ncbi:glycosyltransferase family 1 protein [Chryseotalea sanaruensis]|uniref:Glycosyltransferase family 1 protein n=2 Tax=Chryseotalea sanaruensis TaxID=2482724 RepID=A0A401U9P0_9BACT|nr:glycosyltransferase family 1 protein [Chryseotalea sanaruensis]